MGCSECGWWQYRGLAIGQKVGGICDGFCHKRSPNLIVGLLTITPDTEGTIDCSNRLEAIWPKTFDYDWCGDYKQDIRKVQDAVKFFRGARKSKPDNLKKGVENE